jgi:ribose transport system ATP-binding protein
MTATQETSSVTGHDAQEVAALRVTNASKTFGPITVLNRVDLTVRGGEIHALVGENGSGKSTLVKILAGYHTPDAGTEICVAGTALKKHHPDVSDYAGLRFVHQDLGLVGNLDAVENLGLGTGYGTHRGGPVRWRRQRSAASDLLASIGRTIDLSVPVAQLTASERTSIAIARAIAPHRTPARVLVLDEPTANLPGPEVEQLFDVVHRVRDRGIAVVFISHHLSEVLELTDNVTVLRGGRRVTTIATSSIDEERLIELMVGRKVDRLAGQPPEADTPVIVSANNLRGQSVQGLDLHVRAGEVLGIAGITGSGREAIASLLFGATHRDGTVTVDGVNVPPRRPDIAIASGMVLVPADRPANGVLHGHDVTENITISRPRDFVRALVYRHRLATNEARAWFDRLDIRAPSTGSAMTELSGGNAQKVILARCLRLTPRTLLLDEPTQGVDVGSREEIHQRIEEAARAGCAVVVCSTDNEELARLCSRVIVLVHGKSGHEFAGRTTADQIAAASLASHHDSTDVHTSKMTGPRTDDPRTHPSASHDPLGSTGIAAVVAATPPPAPRTNSPKGLAR